MLAEELTPFPWNSWTDATRGNEWKRKILRWFEANYERQPQPTMKQLLNYIFEVIQKSPRGSLHRQAVTKLGKELRVSPVLASNIGLENPHHYYIMHLLELDIQSRHSHLFMLPQVDKDILLERPGYSALLLAAKLHAIGDYEETLKIAADIGHTCSLAKYVTGQSERRLAIYDQAHMALDQGLELLKRSDYVCPFDQNAKPICDLKLLEAVILRAKAVVFRKQKDYKNAEIFFAQAEVAAEQGMTAVSSKTTLSESDLIGESKDIIRVDSWEKNAYRIASDVVADVHFSHGYYWYQKHNYDKAENLFEKAISALEKAKDDWDSPYTRLAIVQFCKGNYQDAAQEFAIAIDKCNRTLNTNREASLSLALCILGRKIIELSYSAGRLTHDDPLQKLENAINHKPELAIGPLECHRDDAGHFLERELPDSAQELVCEFIDRLQKEIDKISPSQETGDGDSKPNVETKKERQREDIKKLIANQRRRLQMLKEQQALKGANTPPEILIEIEDIEVKIKDLEVQLEGEPY